MDEHKSAEETIQNYFDDLFTGADGVIAPAKPLHVSEPHLPAVDKPAAEPPVKPARERKPKSTPNPKSTQSARQASKPLAKPIEPSRYQAPVSDIPLASYAEPAILPQHKAKVEKLLDAARVQLKPKEAPVSVSVPEVIAKVEVNKPVVAAEPEITESIEPELDSFAWEANGRPTWAQNDFDVLLFKVSGLTLAVPLVALGQIQPITDELTQIFGQADWFMGLQPTALGKIRTVNTALFVMPERYDEAFLDTAKLVISINGLEWGLAVDSVNQPITLNPDAVKWRSERSKRPWLAGTVKEQMCALIDVPMMGKLLLEADTNTHKA